MASSGNWLKLDAPSGWPELIVRTLKIAVVAFVVLQLKELRDAGHFDTGGTAVDAGLIAGGTLLLNAALGFAKPSRAPAESASLARGESR
jgi:hypothetical protein